MRLRLLTQKVSHGLESLLLSEEEANLAGGSVSLQFQETDTTFLPLGLAVHALSVSVELASDFHDALKVFFSSLSFNESSLDLNKRKIDQTR